MTPYLPLNVLACMITVNRLVPEGGSNETERTFCYGESSINRRRS